MLNPVQGISEGVIMSGTKSMEIAEKIPHQKVDEASSLHPLGGSQNRTDNQRMMMKLSPSSVERETDNHRISSYIYAHKHTHTPVTIERIQVI